MISRREKPRSRVTARTTRSDLCSAEMSIGSTLADVSTDDERADSKFS